MDKEVKWFGWCHTEPSASWIYDSIRNIWLTEPQTWDSVKVFQTSSTVGMGAEWAFAVLHPYSTGTNRIPSGNNLKRIWG